MPAEQNEIDPSNILLAVDVPESATAGSTFHVELQNRYFEVTVPEGILPGQAINIIVPQKSATMVDLTNGHDATVFNSVESVRDAAVMQARELDEVYKITDKIKLIDETYKISERAQNISSTIGAQAQALDAKFDIATRVNSVLSSGIAKAKEIDERNSLSNRAIVIGERVIAFAREVDAKYALSSTSAHVVVLGANVILAAWRKALAIDAQHRIMERVGLKKSPPPAITAAAIELEVPVAAAK